MSHPSPLSVVVTGATGALGSAVVEAVVESGSFCHVPCRSEAKASGFRLKDHPRVQTHVLEDLTDEAAVSAFYDSLPALWSSIHVAGGFAMAPVEDTPLDMFDTMMTMNARTCFVCCKYAASAIRKTNKGGRIVNVAARPVLEPSPGKVAYNASKAAVASITETLALELAPDGIWVNAIIPSIMDTPSNRAAMPDENHDSWPSVEHVAQTIEFLASERNQLTHGALIPVFGGT